MIKTKIIGMIRDSSRYVIDMDIPHEWFDVLLKHYDTLLDDERLGDIISTLIMNQLNDLEARRK